MSCLGRGKAPRRHTPRHVDVPPSPATLEPMLTKESWYASMTQRSGWFQMANIRRNQQGGRDTILWVVCKHGSGVK